MATRKVISLVVLALLLIGCSNNQVGTGKQSPVLVPANSGVDNLTPINQTKSPLVTQDGETRPTPPADKPASGQIKPIDPVIVQSDPELAKDTEAVLNDISKELDSLTEVLSGLEESDTAWNQEVSKP